MYELLANGERDSAGRDAAGVHQGATEANGGGTEIVIAGIGGVATSLKPDGWIVGADGVQKIFSLIKGNVDIVAWAQPERMDYPGCDANAAIDGERDVGPPCRLQKIDHVTKIVSEK